MIRINNIVKLLNFKEKFTPYIDLIEEQLQDIVRSDIRNGKEDQRKRNIELSVILKSFNKRMQKLQCKEEEKGMHHYTIQSLFLRCTNAPSAIIFILGLDVYKYAFFINDLVCPYTLCVALWCRDIPTIFFLLPEIKHFCDSNQMLKTFVEQYIDDLCPCLAPMVQEKREKREKREKEEILYILEKTFSGKDYESFYNTLATQDSNFVKRYEAWTRKNCSKVVRE